MVSLTLYFDRNIGRAVPDALRTLRLDVEHHCDHFEPDVTDDVWLKAIGERGWVAVTHDRKLHTKDVELEALLQWKVGCFYLWGGQASRWEKMRCFVRAYDKIMKIAENTRRPFVYQCDRLGRLKRIPLRKIAKAKKAAATMLAAPTA